MPSGPTLPLSPVASLGPIVSPGLVTSPSFIMSPNPTTSPNPDSEDTADHQSPSPIHMDVDPIPTVTNPPSNAPPYAFDTAPETTLSPSLDPNLATDESRSDLHTGSLSLPDPGPLPLCDVPQQPCSLTTQAKLPVAFTQLLAAVVVEGTFDIKGIHGKFINKTTAWYWKDIRGGDKWISMLRSYIDLERMPKANGIHYFVCLSQRV